MARYGKSLIYQTMVGGAAELNVLNLTDGTTRRLTNSPEDESGAEFTPDDKSVAFRRSQTSRRIYTVDVRALLEKPAP